MTETARLTKIHIPQLKIRRTWNVSHDQWGLWVARTIHGDRSAVGLNIGHNKAIHCKVGGRVVFKPYKKISSCRQDLSWLGVSTVPTEYSARGIGAIFHFNKFSFTLVWPETECAEY